MSGSAGDGAGETQGCGDCGGGGGGGGSDNGEESLEDKKMIKKSFKYAVWSQLLEV